MWTRPDKYSPIGTGVAERRPTPPRARGARDAARGSAARRDGDRGECSCRDAMTVDRVDARGSWRTRAW